MAAPHFDFNPIRNTAIALVKQFGKKIPCTLIRAVEGSAPDPTLPWRLGDASFLQFKFIGVVSTLGFPKRSDPITDQDQDVIAPGDLATTGAESDATILCGDPTRADRIIAGNLQLGILGIQDVTPDDKVIIYKMRCRAWPLILSAPRTPY